MKDEERGLISDEKDDTDRPHNSQSLHQETYAEI